MGRISWPAIHYARELRCFIWSVVLPLLLCICEWFAFCKMSFEQLGCFFSLREMHSIDHQEFIWADRLGYKKKIEKFKFRCEVNSRTTNQTKRDRLIKIEIINYEGVSPFKAMRSISWPGVHLSKPDRLSNKHYDSDAKWIVLLPAKPSGQHAGE